MTALTSIVDLEAVPVGEQITVREAGEKRRWERVQSGLKHQGTDLVLPLDKFTGAMAQGIVSSGLDAPEVGQCWTADAYGDHRYRRIVLHVDPEAQAARVLSFRYDHFQRYELVTFDSFNRWRIDTEPAVWVRPATEVGTQMRMEYARLRTQVDDLSTRVTRLHDSMS